MPKRLKDSPQPDTKWIDLTDFEFLCFDLARAWMTYNEPIPDFSTVEIGLLESALGLPRQTFDGKLLYPTLGKQAAILFYTLIKNHPFKNGNKRIAVMSLLTFLYMNGKWLEINADNLYFLALYVSQSNPSNRNVVLEEVEKTIVGELIDFPSKTD